MPGTKKKKNNLLDMVYLFMIYAVCLVRYCGKYSISFRVAAFYHVKERVKPASQSCL